MSKILTALCVVLLIASTCDAQHAWTKLDGPYGSRGLQGLFASPGGTFYAAIGQILLRSRDRGESWQELPNTPSGFKTFNYLAPLQTFVFGADRSIVMSVGFRTYLSSDEGDSWLMLADSGKQFIGTGKPKEYFVCIADSIFRTMDNGVSWSRINYGGSASYVGWSGGDTYVVLGTGSQLSMTTDGWNSLKKTGIFTGGITQIGKLNSTEYFVHGRDFVSGADQVMIGDLVHPQRMGFNTPAMLEDKELGVLEGRGLVGMTTIGNSNPAPYSGCYPVLYLLDTASKGMTPAPSMPPYERLYPLTYVEINKRLSIVAGDTLGTILYWTGDGVFRTLDNGKTWKELPLAYDYVSAIQVDRQGRIFTKLYADGVWSWIKMSENNGKVWSRISPIGGAVEGIIGQGYSGGLIATVADSSCDLAFLDLYYFGGTESASWTKLSRPSLENPPGNSILTDSADNVLFFNRGTYVTSSDEGITWDATSTLPIGTTTVAFSPLWKMYATDGTTIYTSGDDGVTWNKLSIGLRNLLIRSVIVPTEHNIYFSTQQSGVYHSTDDGMSWTKVIGPWGDTVSCVASTKDGTVYLGTPSRGLFSIDPNGNKPVQEPLQLPTNQVNTLYVSRGTSVYVGAAWSPVWVCESASAGVAPNISQSSSYHVHILGRTGGVPPTLSISCDDDVVLRSEVFNEIGTVAFDFGSHRYAPGSYSIPIDLHTLASGSYFLRISSDHDSKVLPLHN